MELTSQVNDTYTVLIYGESGSGKSTLAASAPCPQLVALFDSLGNGAPYLRGCRVKRCNGNENDAVIVLGKVLYIPTYLVYEKEDVDLTTLKRKLWHFGVSDPNNPIGRAMWEIKQSQIVKDMDEIHAEFFILDSLTMFQKQARKGARFANPDAKLQEKDWAYDVTDMVENLCMLLLGLQRSSILLAHINNTLDGKGQREYFVSTLGRMQRDIRAMFSDVWYCYTAISPSLNESNYLVNTNSEGGFAAKNTVNGLNNVPNTFSEVVKNQEPILWV